jgi:hypothetical protein
MPGHHDHTRVLRNIENNLAHQSLAPLSHHSVEPIAVRRCPRDDRSQMLTVL